MKRFTRTGALLATMLSVLSMGSLAYAESDTGVNGDAQARLNFQVSIPKILYLQIGGSGATIDTVSFNVTDVADNEATVSGDNSPAVKVAAIVGTSSSVILSADSSAGMTGSVTGSTIPFSAVTTSGTGDFSSVSSLAFDGTASQQVWSATGGGMRTGSLGYAYTNSYSYAPDTYSGQITYTLSSP